MSTALIELRGELHAVQAAPAAARTGVWRIRPDLALRWARRSPEPNGAGHDGPTGMAMLRALGVLSAVLVAGILGGVGAWALSV